MLLVDDALELFLELWRILGVLSRELAMPSSDVELWFPGSGSIRTSRSARIELHR